MSCVKIPNIRSLFIATALIIYSQHHCAYVHATYRLQTLPVIPISLTRAFVHSHIHLYMMYLFLPSKFLLLLHLESFRACATRTGLLFVFCPNRRRLRIARWLYLGARCVYLDPISELLSSFTRVFVSIRDNERFHFRSFFSRSPLNIYERGRIGERYFGRRVKVVYAPEFFK